MGSPYEFQAENTQVGDNGTRVADGSRQNPFRNQIYGSGASNAPYFEQGRPWRASPSADGYTGPMPTPTEGGAEVPTWTPANTPLAGGHDADIPPSIQVADQGRGTKDGPPADFSSGNNNGADLSGSTGSRGSNNWWYLDRAAMLGSSVYAAHRGIPGAEKFLPTSGNALRGLALEVQAGYQAGKWSGAGNALKGGFGGTASTIGTAGKEFLQSSAKADLGKVLGGSFIATTALDLTLLSGRTTSWKTLAVDVAMPLASAALFGKWASPLKIIGITAGAHTLEKLLFEDKK
jgi:hypothetical protein